MLRIPALIIPAPAYAGAGMINAGLRVRHRMRLRNTAGAAGVTGD